MEGAVSDVGICNLAYAGRLEELRAQLLRDRALATKADQVSRLRPSLPAGARAGGLRARFPPGGSCHTQPPSPRFPAHRRSLLPSGQPDRAALGLLGGTHGRRRPPPRPGRARERQGRCECRGHPGTPPFPPVRGRPGAAGGWGSAATRFVWGIWLRSFCPEPLPSRFRPQKCPWPAVRWRLALVASFSRQLGYPAWCLGGFKMRTQLCAP